MRPHLGNDRPPATPHLVAIAICVAALVGARPAVAQPASPATAPTPAAPPAPAVNTLSETLTGEAKGEYEAGRILFQDGDFGNAIIKFERAYALARDPRLLSNVALCQKNLKRYARMLGTLEKLLVEGGSMLTPPERQDVNELIQVVEPLVSRIEITVDPAGATVTIDGAPVGTSPLDGPVRVDLGAHKIRVSKKGFKDHAAEQELAGGKQVALKVTLEPEVHRGRLVLVAGKGESIALDGKVLGLGTWEGAVASGGHTLRVTAPGKVPYQTEVMLEDDQVRRIQVPALAPTPGGNETWIWIGGGAALLVAGAVVAGVLLFQPADPTVGTVPPGTVQLAEGGRRGGQRTWSAAVSLPFGGAR